MKRAAPKRSRPDEEDLHDLDQVLLQLDDALTRLERVAVGAKRNAQVQRATRAVRCAMRDVKEAKITAARLWCRGG